MERSIPSSILQFSMAPGPAAHAILRGMSEVERPLVVDDEAPILHALQRTFEAAGYEVTACADPAVALEKLKEKPFQVLSADYMMPGMTGAEFLARARQLQPETVRILLTAAHDFSAAVD